MQRYFVKDKIDGYLELENKDMHHIKNVMRNKIGDQIECVYDGKLYGCEILSLDNNRVKIIEEYDENNELSCDITIAVALVKEQKMDLILQKLTELGVKRIIPLKMERSIIKIDPKKVKQKVDRWEKICKEASEQSKRNMVPEVMEPITLKELNDIYFEKKFFCSTKNQDNLISNCLQDGLKCATMVFVIGPEGGISSSEEEYLESIGYEAVSFGKRIMRVETAAIYVASVANFCSLG